MSKEGRRSLKAFALELLIYGCFVTAYLLLVLHLLEEPLKGLFDRHRVVYAVVALALIAGQGVVLEAATTALLRLFRPKGR